MTKRVYKRSMAAFLIDYGCTFLRTAADVVDPTKLNWVFEDDALLREGMTAYTAQLPKK